MSYLQKCDEIYISYFFDHVLVYTLDQPYLLSVQQLQTTDMTDCCVEILTLKWGTTLTLVLVQDLFIAC